MLQQRVPLETGSGAPCPHEGGFRGKIAETATVAVCCSNHCGSINNPNGVSTPWSQHPGTWSITGHSGKPCTFYETKVPAGEYNICCGTCWGSGLFLARPTDNHLSQCTHVSEQCTPSHNSDQVATVGPEDCGNLDCTQRCHDCPATVDCGDGNRRVSRGSTEPPTYPRLVTSVNKSQIFLKRLRTSKCF